LRKKLLVARSWDRGRGT